MLTLAATVAGCWGGEAEVFFALPAGTAAFEAGAADFGVALAWLATLATATGFVTVGVLTLTTLAITVLLGFVAAAATVASFESFAAVFFTASGIGVFAGFFIALAIESNHPELSSFPDTKRKKQVIRPAHGASRFSFQVPQSSVPVFWVTRRSVKLT
ncbi:hypothetical protein [Undibacterium sp. CCC3.4]|uniref:hypothetical protein n=1 Tax=Undibacterium sp. CCC3.4 TaxID=3048609 RepID=UPI002AC9B2E1|nr:hypothetical protein [Undibacterium sp. CCC3.4]MEB0213623.1 hypothetical protein [Undibacterium sp. 5I2]WPX43792.1 hypothetical protein RHM61_00720 [Undibacterium sp. CCC3.4]